MDVGTILHRNRRLRTMGIDDGPFERGRGRNILVVGAVYSGDRFEGLVTTRVRQDGYNATQRLTQTILSSKFHAQLHLVMIDGITLGGFNVVDLAKLAELIQIPCLAIMRHHPDLVSIERALKYLSGSERRREIMERAGPIFQAGSIYFQVTGLDVDTARRAIFASTFQGNIPECLRGAHLIASGLVLGENGRRA